MLLLTLDNKDGGYGDDSSSYSLKVGPATVKESNRDREQIPGDGNATAELHRFKKGESYDVQLERNGDDASYSYAAGVIPQFDEGIHLDGTRGDWYGMIVVEDPNPQEPPVTWFLSSPVGAPVDDRIGILLEDDWIGTGGFFAAGITSKIHIPKVEMTAYPSNSDKILSRGAGNYAYTHGNVMLNDDDDDGDGMIDFLDDYVEGGDDDLLEVRFKVTLPSFLQSVPGTLSLSFGDNLRVWTNRDKTEEIQKNDAGIYFDLDGEHTVFVEGVRAGRGASSTVSARYTPDLRGLGQGYYQAGLEEDAISLQVIDYVDLDIDSNNVGGIDSRDGGSFYDSEDLNEDESTVFDEEKGEDIKIPGKIIQVHTVDSDGDGILDFADFGGNSNNVPVDSDQDIQLVTSAQSVASQPLTPVRLTLAHELASKESEVVFHYDASHPTEDLNAETNTVTDGSLRLWTSDYNPLANDFSNVAAAIGQTVDDKQGQFIESDVYYTVQELEDAGAVIESVSGMMVIHLFAEAVAESTDLADKRISVSVTNDDEDGNEIEDADHVRATTFRFDTVTISETGTTTVTNQLALSNPSPIFTKSTVNATNLRWGADGHLYGDLRLEGELDNAESDFDPEIGIPYILAVVNDDEEYEVSVTAKRQPFNPQSLLKPWDYTGTFDRTFENVSLLPGENRISLLAASPGSGHQGFATWRFVVVSPDSVPPTVQNDQYELLSKSNGGDFNPFTIQYRGPEDLAAHFEFTTDDGGRKITKGPGGNFYLAAKDTESNEGKVAILQQRLIRGAADAAYAMLNPFSTDRLNFSRGFVEGFIADGAIGTLEGLWTVTASTFNYLGKSFHHNFNMGIRLFGFTPEPIDFTSEGTFLFETGQAMKNVAEVAGRIASEIQQLSYDTTLAVLTGDERALNEVSDTLASSMRIAGTFILDALLYATELEPRDIGRLVGMITFEALGIAAGGAGVAAKIGKAPKVVQFVDRMADVAKNAKVPAPLRNVLQKTIDAPVGGVRRIVGIQGLKNAENFVPLRGQHKFTCGINCAFHAVGDISNDFAKKGLALRHKILEQEGLDHVQLSRFIEELGDFAVVAKFDLPGDEVIAASRRGKLLAFVDGRMIGAKTVGHWVHLVDVFTKEGKSWARIYDSGRGGYYDQLLDSFVTRTAQVTDNPFLIVIPD